MRARVKAAASPQRTVQKSARTSPQRTVHSPIVDAAEALGLSRRLLPDASWDRWRLVLRCALGDTGSLSAADRALIADCTGHRPLPSAPVRELWSIDGRRSGKTTFDALLAVAVACFTRYRAARGERPTVLVIAADRTQAGIAFDYIVGMLESAPSLAAMIVRKTADTIDLSNRVRIQVAACSFRSTRGFTCLLCIADEIAFWRVDDGSRNPDSEVLTAIRPALATTGGLLVCSSTPYARRGELHKAHERHFGKPGPVLVWRAPSLVMNPSLDAARIAEARADDPTAAASEWDAEFRADITSFLDPEALAAVVEPGVLERGPVRGISYVAFCDPSGGGADSFTLAIAHADGDRAMLDCVREIPGPCDPRSAVAELAGLCKEYRVSRVVGDRYSGAWVRSAFDSHAVRYDVSERTKSELYLEALPLVNARRCSLLDLPRLRAQLLGLERRSGRGGRDSVDHGPGGHDDVANAAVGALVQCHVGLGRVALSSSFTGCLKEGAVPSFSFAACYLAGGTYIPSDPICRECPGHQGALALYRKYVEAGGTPATGDQPARIEDLREWSKSNVRLPEGLAWAALYRRLHAEEAAAGAAYDRFIEQQRARWSGRRA